MSLRKTSRSHHGTLNELNITPLLDLAFVLLVIFIITTPQLVNHLEMTLPSAQPPPVQPDAPKPEVHRIGLNSQGQVSLDDAPVDLPSLREHLQRARTANPEVAVVVNGDDEVACQSMISVLDILQQLEITRVGLATQATAAR